MKILIGSLALLIFVFFAFNGMEANVKSNIFSADSNKVKTKETVKTQKTKKVNIGIGPIKKVKLGPLNKKLVKEGKNIFDSKCMACHRLDMKLVGPPLRNITKKLSPVYIMNYLLNTSEMQKKEPQLKKLIKEYHGVVMPDQNLKKRQARAVLEYFRSVEK